MRGTSPRVVGTSFYLGIPSGCRSSAYDTVSLAADLGVRHFFTSLQMPEADIPGNLDEFRRIAVLAGRMDLAIMADVHPVVFQRIGGSIADFAPLRDLGVTSVRLDAGFSDEETHELLATANQFHMQVVLNASAANPLQLDRLDRLGVRLDGTVACHNYYPRAQSGLARSFVSRQADLLHAHRVIVMGFVPSQKNRRSMTYEGLPTLECHRAVEPGAAAQELLAMGWCDQVYIGDQTDDPEELKRLLAARHDPALILRIRLNPAAQAAERVIALGQAHDHLPQAFELVYRARGARQKPDLPRILPQPVPLPRPRGTVTVDNVLYARYAGELQIARVDLPADPRVNVVGWVAAEDLPLLESLGPRVRFRFYALPEP